MASAVADSVHPATWEEPCLRQSTFSLDLRPAPTRIWRFLSDLLARDPYGSQRTTFELPVGGPVRYEDARSALEKLGAARQDAGLKTQTWDRKPTT